MTHPGPPSKTKAKSSPSAARAHGYSGWHRIYYHGAIESLATFERRREVLLRLERRVFAPTYRGGPLVERYIQEMPGLLVLAANTQILSSMATEALLNLYGVMRFGERVYKRAVERLSPVQKLELVLEIFDKYEVTPNDQLVVLIRQLFEVRNKLVHPKSKEARLSDPVELPRPGALAREVREAVQRMKMFFELFGKVSDETQHALLFFGPLA